MKKVMMLAVLMALSSITVLGKTTFEASTLGWESNSSRLEKNQDRYYQVVFIWVKDPKLYQEYATKLGPVVGKYGGRAERIIGTVTSYYGGQNGKDLQQPHMINIVSYESKAAYEKFEKDPEFLKLKDLRAKAIDMAGVSGSAESTKVDDGDLSKRLYMVEFVNYANKKDYNGYLKKAKSLYKRHGHHTEYRFIPDMRFGNLKQTPNMVNIMYFETEAGKETMHKDKGHKAIEDAYADTVTDLIWIEGKPMVM